MMPHLLGRDHWPMCGDRPHHFQAVTAFGPTRCIRCVQLVRDAATAAGLVDPCRPKSLR